MLFGVPDPAVAAGQLGMAVGGAVVFALLAYGVVLTLDRASGSLVGVVSGWSRVIDDFLARRMAGWLGLDEVRAVRRWMRLAAWLVGLSLVGAFAPWPFAIVALTAGLVAVMAVFRRWTWDEEDRALGLPAHRKRVAGVEDYNDELLAALGSIFMFGSLLVWRLSGLHLFDPAASRGLIGNLLYMASETLEALPIIGNIEVLGYDNPSGVEIVQPRGGGVAFAIRMMLDLIVIGGLFKAAEIAGRVARGLDLRRQENALRAARSQDEVEDILDTVSDLASRGNAQATGLLESLALPPPEVPGSSPSVRRAAADRLLHLGDEGAVLATSALNTAILTYDVLLTPELQQQDPLEWLRCQAARAQALYLLGLRAGGPAGAARLAEAEGGFQIASRGHALLGQPRQADAAELGYWAAVSERMSMIGTPSSEELATLSDQIQDFIDRMSGDPEADPKTVEETRRLLKKVQLSRAAKGHIDVASISSHDPASGQLSPAALIDQAELLIMAFGQAPSAEAAARLVSNMTELERLHGDAGNAPADRATAALRLAQGWAVRAEIIHDASQFEAAAKGLEWCEETRRLGQDLSSRVRSHVNALEARCLIFQTAHLPPGAARDGAIERNLELSRRVIADPELRGDPLLDETRANLVMSLIGAAESGDRDLAVTRLQEAITVASSIIEDQAGGADQTRVASTLLNMSKARRLLATIVEAGERRALLDQVVADAERSAEMFAQTGNAYGHMLALKSLGDGLEGIVELERQGPVAEASARRAVEVFSKVTASLEGGAQFDLWCDTEVRSLLLLVFIGVLDLDRPKVEAAVQRYDDLLGRLAGSAHSGAIPFVEQARGRAQAMLRDWPA